MSSASFAMTTARTVLVKAALLPCFGDTLLVEHGVLPYCAWQTAAKRCRDDWDDVELVEDRQEFDDWHIVCLSGFRPQNCWFATFRGFLNPLEICTVLAKLVPNKSPAATPPAALANMNANPRDANPRDANPRGGLSRDAQGEGALEMRAEDEEQLRLLVQSLPQRVSSLVARTEGVADSVRALLDALYPARQVFNPFRGCVIVSDMDFCAARYGIQYAATRANRFWLPFACEPSFVVHHPEFRCDAGLAQRKKRRTAAAPATAPLNLLI